MRNSSAANSAASSPPVPARTSRIALRSSASSLGRSRTFSLCSNSGNRSLSSCSSASANSRMSASVASSATSSASSAISSCVLRSSVMPSTTGVRSEYSLSMPVYSGEPGLGWLATWLPSCS